MRDVHKGIVRQEGEDYYLIPSRADAIEFAARIAKSGDTVLLAGIGHQNVLLTNFGTIPWSEKQHIKSAVDQLSAV